MSRHAPLPDHVGDLGDRAAHPGVRERALPPQLRRACDDLFTDADRHGPRRVALMRRILPAVALLPLAFATTLVEPWRRALVDLVGVDRADVLLVLPVLLAIVIMGAAMAPLARIRTEPLLGGGLVLLAVGAWMVHDGQVAWASMPSAGGALLLGLAAARVVRRAVWALPLLLAAGVSDAHSVAFGVTDRLLDDGVQSTSGGHAVSVSTTIPVGMVERIDLLVLHVPVASGTWMLGLVDVLAIGMLLGLAHLFWLPLGRTAAALAAAVAVSVMIGGAVPVLPLLGVAWVLANARLVWRSTRFSLRRLTYLGG
ncbi:MAG: hypothetical protein KDC46_11745 [Thermoleophilia bacterium]|nr:hypothetical protein [Thermoleophilia bacterium]